MNGWLTPKQLSERTGIAVGTLANWRSASTPANPQGPASMKVGRLVRYSEDAVTEWQQSLEAVAS